MATPLNTFKTVTAELTTSGSLIYTTPANTTTIVLMAQVSNITATDTDVTASHVKIDIDGSTLLYTELIKDFTVPGNDAVGVLSGKLILEAGQSFYAEASVDSRLKLVLSLLETI